MNQYNNFSLDRGNFCLISNIRNYLSYYKLDRTEIWLGGVMGWLGFYYTRNLLPCREIIHGRNGDFSDIFHRLENQLSEKFNKERLRSGEEALSLINGILKDEHIPLVWINDFYLQHTDYYQLSSYWSLVPVLEIENNKVVYFDNGLRNVECDTFLNAISNDGNIDIMYLSSRELNWEKTEQTIMTEGLRDSISKLTFYEPKSGEYNGIEGIKSFAEDLMNYTDPKFIYHLYYLINNPGGLTITRKSTAQLCEELKNKWPTLHIDECRQLFDGLSENWRMTANLLFKLSRTSDRDLQNRIAERVRDIFYIEEKGAELLMNLVQQLERLKYDYSK